MPYFTKCCCCLSLRSGGIIMGVLAVIGALLTIALCSLGYYGTVESETNPHLAQVLNQSIQAYNQTNHNLKEEDVSAVVLVVRIWMILCIILSILTLVCALSWLYGVMSVSRLNL